MEQSPERSLSKTVVYTNEPRAKLSNASRWHTVPVPHFLIPHEIQIFPSHTHIVTPRNHNTNYHQSRTVCTSVSYTHLDVYKRQL